MSRDSIRPHLTEIVAQRTLASQGPDTRDNLTMRSKRMHEAYPRALDLERDALDAVRPQMAGVGSVLCGTHDADYFRDMLLGNRQSLPLYDICRLALSERPEAGAAVDALLEVLARARRKTLSPMAESSAPLRASASAAGNAAARIAMDVCDALEDGDVDDVEATRLDADMREMGRRVAQWKADYAAGKAQR